MILSTFGAARPVFDESGSQKSDFPLCSLRFLIILPSALDFSRKGFFKARSLLSALDFSA
ncbi:hypothetical protein, partial [Ligilactobacillus ruminis]|uniref:hypothetical protein n=1 Tax=Ligilactobacillus ruminis TaxID=1623 RepID=UPI0019D33709